RGELQGDLLGGRGQRVLDGEPDRGLERRDEAPSYLSRLVPAGLGRELELAADALDVGVDVHGATMAPFWHHVNAKAMPSWHLPAAAIQGNGSGVSRGSSPRCSAATRFGTTIRQASTTSSRISSSSMASSRTTTQCHRISDGLGSRNLSGSEATSASRSSLG